MKKKTRLLTKSRFKLGMECPTKLFYTKKKQYPDSKLSDPFLASLAEGGFQVGELSKAYFPEGHDVKALDYETALSETATLLEQENVVIFEAAIKFKNLFIRIDILKKNGNSFELIEVKAKSFDSSHEDAFFNKNGSIKSTWKPYLEDVAFQSYVLSGAFPKSQVKSFLMMADKNAACPTDGLHQKFMIEESDGRKCAVQVEKLTDEELREKVLKAVDVSDVVLKIHSEDELRPGLPASFDGKIHFLSEKYRLDERIISPLGAVCAKCEFRCTDEDKASGGLSGFEECWSLQAGVKDSEFLEPLVLELWSSRKKDKFVEGGKFFLKDLSQEDIVAKSDKKDGLSSTERQWLQVEKVIKGDKSFFLDKENLLKEIDSWKWPLNFIDFETSAAAIPFHAGMKPYEGIAFQFSHHTLSEDGSVAHAGEYINTKRSFFPNFEFIRELKKSLSKNGGTVFCYSPHENTYLNLIYRQLLASEELDKEELLEFIQEISHSTAKSDTSWIGKRDMVDLWKLVKRFYFDPATGGSNSIKAILPAVLNSSSFLKQKYSKAIYGSESLISKNFSDFIWFEEVNGKVVDPYKKLPSVFEGISKGDQEFLMNDDIRNGGAALTAYAKMQYTQMTEKERDLVLSALKKYCELDTLAMVMIVEGWMDFLGLRSLFEAA